MEFRQSVTITRLERNEENESDVTSQTQTGDGQTAAGPEKEGIDNGN